MTTESAWSPMAIVSRTAPIRTHDQGVSELCQDPRVQGGGRLGGDFVAAVLDEAEPGLPFGESAGLPWGGECLASGGRGHQVPCARGTVMTGQCARCSSPWTTEPSRMPV